MAERDERRDEERGDAEDREGSPQDGGSKRRSDQRSNGRLTSGQVVQAARHQLVEITGRPAYSVSGLTRTDEGWTVRVDLVELERIPPSTSVLASYEVDLDQDGELLGYERTRRYHLAQTDE